MVYLSKTNGVPDAITFIEEAATILKESFENDDQVDENIKMARSLGKIISNDSEALPISEEYYPNSNDVKLEKPFLEIPITLSSFIESIFATPRSGSARRKKQLLQTSICHVIMHVAGKKYYVSSLLISVGIFLHQTTRSRIILDALSSLGLCASYQQVMLFEKAAAVHVSNGFLDAELKKGEKLPFCQWVADNFDFNEDTITGENTTHVMGIITCINPKSESVIPLNVPKKTVSNREIINAGSLSHYLERYKHRCDSLLFELEIKELQKPVVAVSNVISLDLFWSFSSIFVVNPSNWHGFLSQQLYSFILWYLLIQKLTRPHVEKVAAH